MDSSQSKRQSTNVLLVEDNPTQAKLIELVFEETEGIELVQIVKDGVEALEYLNNEGRFTNTESPDMVLLDLNMPRKDGIEVLQEVKSNHRLKTLPIVVLTTSSHENDVRRSFEAGAVSFISKPVEFSELQNVLARFAEYWTTVSRLP